MEGPRRMGEYLLFPSHLPPFFSEWKERNTTEAWENRRMEVWARELESARGGTQRRGRDETTSFSRGLALMRNKMLLSQTWG